MQNQQSFCLFWRGDLEGEWKLGYVVAGKAGLFEDELDGIVLDDLKKFFVVGEKVGENWGCICGNIKEKSCVGG